MPVKLANNAVTIIREAISASDTTIVVALGSGSIFPELNAGDYFYATLSSANGDVEIVRVNTRNGDTMTVVRGQEDTTPRAFPVNSRFELRVTAQSVLDALSTATNYQGASDTDPTTRLDGTPLEVGDFYFNTVINQVRFYTGAGWVSTTSNYQGANSANPVTRLDGSPLEVGDFYFNTVDNQLRFYNGSVWVSVATSSLIRDDFSGDGATTAFTLGLAPSSENNTQVYINGVYQEKSTYSVSGTTLTFNTAPPNGSTVEVITLENVGIPTASLVGYSPAATSLLDGVVTDVEDALDALSSEALGASYIGYTPAGTGAVPTNVQDKLRETVSVKDFGAVGDGVADDTAAILSAFQNGGHVVFPEGTYKVTTVLCENISGLTVDASSATFTSQYGSVLMFKDCDDFAWFGGKINAGTGTNPAFTSSPENLPINFLIFGANRAIVSNLTVVNTASNSMPCITAWNMGQTQINNNQVYNGGDNSIWCFGCFHITVSNNIVIGQERGRGICFQQVNYGAITGNVCSNGKGDGCNVHGSSNIVITGNSIYDMATDPIILGLSSGISIEWDENATPTTVAAAVADPQLYNNVFSRNITVSGNTISKVGFGVRIGNNSGISGDNYGNQGQVVVDGNNIFGVITGISTGTSRQIRIGNNMISTCNQACIEVDMGTDTGGYSAEDIYVTNNRLTLFNITNLSYNAIQFSNGTPVAADRIVLTNNEWDQAQNSAGFTNLSGSVLSVMDGNTSYVNGVATSTTKSALMVQRQFSDQTGSSTLSPFFINKAANEFTQSGQVGDSFTTVLAIPANASIAAQIQIGTFDRVGCFGTIYAHNGTTPALTFTGTGSTEVQLSGGNLQIRGNTSGGTANYGGLYSIRYSLLNPS